MDKGNHFRVRMRFDRSFQLLGVNRIAPTIHDHDSSRPATFDVFLHTSAKDTILANNGFVAALEQIHKSGFHTRRSRRRKRDCKLITRLEGILQEPLHIIHETDEQGIKVTNGRTCRGGKDPWRYVRGTGTHECTNGRMKTR